MPRVVAAAALLMLRPALGTLRPGFSDVRLTITITGPESDERYQELRVAVDNHCPVLDLFANETPVSVTVAKG